MTSGMGVEVSVLSPVGEFSLNGHLYRFEVRYIKVVISDMAVNLRFAVELFETIVQYVVADKFLLGFGDVFAFTDVPPGEHKIRPDDFLCRFGCRGLNSF